MDIDQIVSVPRLVKNQEKGYNKGKKKKKKNRNDPLKVVYISSPMKVKTSASSFRSLVQQLTGKNSDISEYMDGNYNGFFEIGCYDHDSGSSVLAKEMNDDDCQVLSSMDSYRESPTSSDSLGPIDNVFASQIEEQFAGVFKSNFLYNNRPQLDVLGSYDELL